MVAARRVVIVALQLAAPVGALAGQSSTPVASTSGFTPGGQELFVIDFARLPLGRFPDCGSTAPICRLSGAVSVVTKDRRPMLRATELSELLITLPNDQRLPEKFTVEMDIVPKDAGPQPDLTLEGTRSINQGDASAHLMFLGDASFGFFQVVGGQSTVTEVPIPDPIRVTLPETFTRVAVSVEGRVIRFFVNGTEILPDAADPTQRVQARFARGGILRVTLGGVTEDAAVRPVYLGRVRVATGAPVTVAQSASGLTEAVAGTSPAVTGVVARVDAQGNASVSWSAVLGATSYFVVRWKPDNASCCKNFSPPQGMNRLEWADGVLPTPGLYAYRVYATTAAGISVGETTVTYQAVVADPATNNSTDSDRTGVPAAQMIALSGLTASGGVGIVPAQAVELATVTAVGPVGAIAPHDISLAMLTAVGSVKSTTRFTLAEATPVPAPQIVSLAPTLGTGAFGAIKPRTIVLPSVSAGAGSSVPRPQTITLPGLTATGPARTP